MSDTTNCPRTECSCPCLPKVTLDQAVIDLVESIALQDSATNMVHAVANLELVLKDKLEFISNNLYYPPAGTDTSSAC